MHSTTAVNKFRVIATSANWILRVLRHPGANLAPVQTRSKCHAARVRPSVNRSCVLSLAAANRLVRVNFSFPLIAGDRSSTARSGAITQREKMELAGCDTSNKTVVCNRCHGVAASLSAVPVAPKWPASSHVNQPRSLPSRPALGLLSIAEVRRTNIE